VFHLPTLRLGRVFGIPLELNLSWFVVFGVVAWTWSFDVYPSLFPGRPAWVDVTSGLVTTLLFFASIVAHEMSHSLVARRADIPVQRVTLFMFGGVAQLSQEPRSAGTEAVMSLAGPGMSLLLSAACYTAFRVVTGAGAPAADWAPLLMLAGVNLSVAVFNLAPGYPMDGGRVLHAFLWWASGDRRRATRAASWVGQGLGLALAAAGAWTLVAGSIEGLWFVLLGLFLRALAAAAYRSQEARLELATTPVVDLAHEPVLVIAGDLPLDEAPRFSGAAGAPGIAVVTDRSGTAVGLVDLRGAPDRPAAVVGAATVGDMARPLSREILIDGGESVESAARRFEASTAPALFVVKDRRVVAALSRRAVGAAFVDAAKQRRPGPLGWLAPRG